MKKPSYKDLEKRILDLEKSEEEYKISETSLLENLAKYKLLAENISDNLWILDLKTQKFLYTNPSVKNLTGYEQAEAITLSLEQIFLPGSLKIINKTIKDEVEKDEQEDPDRSTTIELEMYHKNGHTVWIEVTAKFIRDKNNFPEKIIGTSRNISERKNSEFNLRESEEYFRSLIENATDVISILDANGIISYESPSHKRVLGYETGFLIGKNAFEYVHPEDRELISKQFSMLLKNPGEIKNVEFRFKHNNGTWRILEGTGKNLLNDPGVKGIVINYRDVTDKRKIENILTFERSMFRSFWDYIPNAIYFKDKECRFVDINSTMAEVMGGIKEEIIGKSDFDFYPNDQAEERYLDENQIMETKKPIKKEEKGNTPSGEKWFLTTKAPRYDENGIVIGTFGISWDITQRKQAEEDRRESEEKFRSISSCALDGIIMLDEEGKIYFWNNAAEKIFGYKENEVIGKEIHSLLSPEKYREDYIKGFAEYRKTGKGEVIGKTLELSAIRKDGDEFPIELSVSSLRLKNKWYSVGILRDITKRKQTEKKIRESEERNRLLIETMNDGIVIVDRKDDIVFVNLKLCEMLGFSFDELYGTSIAEYFDEKNREIINEQTGKRKKGETESYEIEWIKKDNNKIYTIMSPQPIFDENDVFVGSFAVITDITERIISEKALKESEERFQYLAEAAFEAIFINKDGKCLEANQRAADMFGYNDAAELIGIFGTDVIAPESREIAKDHMLNNKTEQYEAAGLRKDSSTFPIEIKVKEMPYRNKGIVRVTAVRDISERKEAEDRFKMAAECTSDMIYEWDIRTNSLDWFGEIDRNLGYEPGEIEHSLEAWLDLIHPDDRGKLTNAVEIHLTSTEPIYEKYRMRRKNGDYSYWTDKGTPIVDETGKPVKWIGACTDITDIIKAEEEKKKLEQQLFHSQKMESIGRLTGGIAHDFNNILSSIMGYAELLKMLHEDTSTPDGEAADIILKSAERASNLTRQLLGFTRKGDFNPEPVDINNVIEESLKVSENIFEKKVDIEYDFYKDISIIEADTNQIDQILTNIFINARDAMPNGGTLSIKTTNIFLDKEFVRKNPKLQPGNFVKMSIRDTGSGMAKETLNQIFEPFFTTKSKNKGTGLGLATVYGIIKNHDGHIDVESEPEKGSTFSIYLPASEKKITDSNKKSEIIHGNETLLVIDDEVDIREMTKKLLESFGYRVLIAKDGIEGLQLFKRNINEIDIVILDIVMPKLSGKDVFFELKNIKPEQKVLIISGQNRESINQEIMKDSNTRFSQKPVAIEDLSKMIFDILRK